MIEDYGTSTQPILSVNAGRNKFGIPPAIMQGGNGDYFPTCWFLIILHHGTAFSLAYAIPSTFNCMQVTATHLLKFDGGDTMCEVCGGEVRTTRALVRYNNKRLNTGPNVDLVAGGDLTEPRTPSTPSGPRD